MLNNTVQSGKVKKSFIFIGLLMAVILFAVSFMSDFSSNSDFDITKYDMKVTFDEEGNMHVKESVTNTYNSHNTVFYKNIKYNKNNSFSSSRDRSNIVRDVKLTVENNYGVTFDSETSVNTDDNFIGYSYLGDIDERGDRISCGLDCVQIFYYDAYGIDEVTTFTYEYTIEGVVTQYNDISEINWVFLDIQSMKVENISIEIVLPQGEYNLENEYAFFHGSSKGNVEFTSNNTVLITASELLSNEMIEARLLVDNDVFSSVNSINKYNEKRLNDILAFEENQIKEGNLISFISVYGVYGVYVLCAFVLVVLTVMAYKKLDKEYVSDFYNEYYRELPGEYGPAIMGALYKFEEIGSEELTATLLDLIRRKYLILDTNNCSVTEENPNYLIKLNPEKDLNELLEYESYLIKWFIEEIGDGKEVSSRVLNSCCDNYTEAVDYTKKYDKWVNLVKKETKKYNFFEKNSSKGKSKFLIMGTLTGVCFALVLYLMINFAYGVDSSKFFIIGSLLSLMVAYLVYISSINKRTVNGNEDYVRWKAFKKFLEEFSTFEDYPIPSLIIWEHYLVYATAFGIADKVTKQLKLKTDVVNLDSSDTTFVMYYGLRYSYVTNMSRSVSGLRSVATTTISRHNSTRGAGGSFRGGGGGFSGGSSFGGGGGSFGGR